MHKKVPLIVLFLVAAGACGLLFVHLFDRHLLVLSDGDIISAQAVWSVGDKVFFRNNGAVDFVDGMAVEKWVNRYSLSVGDLKYRFLLLFQGSRPETGNREAPPPPGDSSFDALWAAHGKTAAGIVLALLAAGAWVVWSRKRPKKQPLVGSGDQKRETAEPPRKKPPGPRLASVEDVAEFFLKIYRMQVGAKDHARGWVKKVPATGKTAGTLYELCIDIGGKQKSRRMTIRPLGEGTSSKSQCFYVIFDSHMVVKIPPVPIRDFDDYIGRIEYESEIVKALSPRKCIIPNVRVILEKVHHFADHQKLSPEQLEERYIGLLKNAPGYHACLKLNGAFVFFMDLSRDFFLSDAMAGLHQDHRAAIVEEDAELQSDCQGFETRYGEANGWICFELQNLYTRFEKELELVKRAIGSRVSLSAPQKRKWFFSHMAGIPVSLPAQGMSDRLQEGIIELLDRLFSQKIDLVRAYQQVVRVLALQRSFSRSRPAMEAIARNLIELLGWLDQCGVALRDLKPDNLLVVGDPTQYPLFLQAAEEFFIGLIDLETGVVHSKTSDGACPQPQLGGTPPYATPSHFFSNEILAELYPDVGSILHLQDWQAVLGIVFETVTGQRLFKRTARQISDTVKTLQRAIVTRQPVDRVYPSANRVFWQQAGQEITEQLRLNAAALEKVSIALPEALRKKLAAFLGENIRSMEEQISQSVSDQPLVSKADQKRQLTTCSYQAVCKLQDRYEKTETTAARKIVPFLHALAECKREKERLEQMNRTLTNPLTALSVADALRLMFDYTASAMGYTRAPAAGLSTPAQPPAGTAEATWVADDAATMPFAETVPTDTPAPSRQADGDDATLAADDEATLGFTHTVGIAETD